MEQCLGVSVIWIKSRVTKERMKVIHRFLYGWSRFPALPMAGIVGFKQPVDFVRHHVFLRCPWRIASRNPRARYTYTSLPSLNFLRACFTPTRRTSSYAQASARAMTSLGGAIGER